MASNLRIHPAIGISRVGNSPEYVLAPESIAALAIPGTTDTAETGGLPLDPATGDQITSSQLRDDDGRLKRQAARFRIYQYPEEQADQYPAQHGEEVVIGSVVDGRTVVDILWQVHVANKKACWYQSPDEWGITAYEQPELGQLVLRNLEEGIDPHNAMRLRKMMIDPGPRVIAGTAADPVRFGPHTVPQVLRQTPGGVAAQDVTRYPTNFPRDVFPPNRLLEPQGAIDTLGELITDDHGRLIVAGGFGRAVGWYTDETRPNLGEETLYTLEITDPVNNDQWFDDTSDGPVHAVLVFDDGSTRAVHPAWVVTTDPAYAPQTLNIVTLWDEVYDSWVRKLDLVPDLYADGHFVPSYRPDFEEDLRPIFRATAMQEWNTYLPNMAILAHRAVGAIAPSDHPDDTILAQLAYVRNPNQAAEDAVGAPLMPLSLGDAGRSFLSVSLTQYFLLERWADDAFDAVSPRPKAGFGEYLDRATLMNCLGGRFSPGIDLTFIVRQPELYVTDWKAHGCGPFRVNVKALEYQDARKGRPFLGFGWTPCTAEARLGCEPGDLSKFMALPWHADYNSCAIHQTDPNDLNSSTLYWSWPAQRPVTVYVAADVMDGELGDQRYSVRGPGTMPEVNSPTDSHDLSNAGRFWLYNDMLVHWHEIGVIMQATNIDDGRDGAYEDGWYLEVQSQLEDGPAELADPHPWPFTGGNDTAQATN